MFGEQIKVIKQSYDCTERVTDFMKNLNGDGFGIGWYDDSVHHNLAVEQQQQQPINASSSTIIDSSNNSSHHFNTPSNDISNLSNVIGMTSSDMNRSQSMQRIDVASNYDVIGKKYTHIY